METVILFYSCSLSADHEVRDTVHADGSTWKMYLSGTIVNTQGMMAERKGLLCEYMYPRRGFLLRWKKKGSEVYIH